MKRFDEQLVLVEGARRIAGREHDDHHLPVPRTNQAGKAPSIGPDGGPHHTDRAAPVTMGSNHQGWETILPRPGCLDLGGQTEDRRLIAELGNDLHGDGFERVDPSLLSSLIRAADAEDHRDRGRSSRARHKACYGPEPMVRIHLPQQPIHCEPDFLGHG